MNNYFEVLQLSLQYMHFKGLVPSLLYLASSQIVFYYWLCCCVFLQGLLDVLEVSFVQFHFLLLSPLGHHYPSNKHRKLCSASPLWIYSTTLYFYLNDKIGQGIQNQDFVSHSLLCLMVLQQILSSRYLIKWDRNASWQNRVPHVSGWNASDHKWCENVPKLKRDGLKRFAVKIALWGGRMSELE